MADYYAVVGMVVIALGAVISLIISIKKSLADDRKPMENLNANLIKLNSNFEHMMELDKVRDKRIEKHGEEIDNIEEQVFDHEKRITVLEKGAK